MSQAALPGFRDFYPDQFAIRSYITSIWRDVARRYAFVEYDGPPLEPLNLYTRKSGEEIVGQLYNFVDKGGREIALRPEMTPTLARMVSAKANAMRKPIRWFSIPQLFRYERQQRGRLREHFQLNVDIIGESSIAADAELLAVAIDVMRSCGLTSKDVRARVSDRKLLSALLTEIGVGDSEMAALYAAIDKIGREPREVTTEKIGKVVKNPAALRRVETLLTHARDLDAIRGEFGKSENVAAQIEDMREYFHLVDALGVADWVDFDLSIVRGLAYYTGKVFELFDARGEFRAICGGGRYDDLLSNIGGVDLPALGFGMGDVVLTELLRARSLLPTAQMTTEYWVAGEGDGMLPEVMRVAAKIRASGKSVEYALKPQTLARQLKTASTVGAQKVVLLRDADLRNGQVTLKTLADGSERHVQLDVLLERS